MEPLKTPYRCRLCGAASYRRLTHRGPEGVMTYSGLYRCSGCSATFADPAAWRQAVAHRGVGIGSSDHTGPKAELLASWGPRREDMPNSSMYGYNATDQKAIQEAAARANRYKGPKWSAVLKLPLGVDPSLRTSDPCNQRWLFGCGALRTQVGEQRKRALIPRPEIKAHAAVWRSESR
jgi:hypothetical protein